MVMRAFRSRNYRLFFVGQFVSLIGTWLSQVALSWLVYDLTGSKFLLGMVAFASQIPAFLLSPWAGVMVDRWNLRRTLVITQSLAMCQSFVIATLALTGVIKTPHILLLAVFGGLVSAFDMPSRQAFVVQILESRDDLANAIALNSSMFNGSRLVGPAVAGVLVATMGPGYCFLLDGFSFMAVILALLAMRLQPFVPPVHTRKVMHDLREGFQYVSNSLPIRVILLQVAIVSLVGTPYVVLMPAFARDVLHGGPDTLGFLTASIGFGALVGGIRLASRKSVLGLGRWIAAGGAMLGISLLAFSFSTTLWISVVCLAACGFSMITQMASSNTVLQTVVDDDKRGRVMSFYGMAFQGMMPLGSLGAGILASTRLGPQGTVAAGAVLSMLASVWFLRKLPEFRKHLRPIYLAKGILPPVAAGLNAADRMQANER